MRRATTLLGVSGGELAIYDDARKELEIVASLRVIGVDSTGMRLALDEGAMGHVAVTRERSAFRLPRLAGTPGKYTDVEVHW